MAIIFTSVDWIVSQKASGLTSLVAASPDLHFLVCVCISIFNVASPSHDGKLIALASGLSVAGHPLIGKESTRATWFRHHHPGRRRSQRLNPPPACGRPRLGLRHRRRRHGWQRECHIGCRSSRPWNTTYHVYRQSAERYNSHAKSLQLNPQNTLTGQRFIQSPWLSERPLVAG